MEISLHNVQHSANKDSTLDHKTKISLRLPGITIVEQNGILFQFLPMKQYSKMFKVFRVDICNGLTLYFTRKAILDRVIIPKDTTLGYLFAIAQLNE